MAERQDEGVLWSAVVKVHSDFLQAGFNSVLV